MRAFLQAMQTLFLLCLVFGSIFLGQSGLRGGGFYALLFSGSLFGFGALGCLIWTVFGLWQPLQAKGPGLHKCPKCEAKLPAVRIPKTRREMLWGGVTCPKCGVELDRHGNPIES